MTWQTTVPAAPVHHKPQGFLSAVRGEPLHKTANESDRLGMVSVRAREQLLSQLQAADIGSPMVWAAMRSVPRHPFVESAFASRAYEDTVLPIGFGQTISQPSVVARMLALACGAAQTQGAWLEIGTGCGYQAALMAHCTKQVCSIERIEGLAQMSRRHIRDLGLSNIALLHGDGTQSWTSQYRSSHGRFQFSQFDAIVVAAAGLGTPAAWIDQLAIGGRLIAPVQGDDGVQRLHVSERRSSSLVEHHVLETVQFVPLLQGTAHR